MAKAKRSGNVARIVAENAESAYGSMIGGSFVIPENGDANRTAYWLAREALNDENVMCIVGREKEHACYLAIPSKALANVGRAQSPLAAALPGAEGHQGDAAYVLRYPASNFAVAVLRRDNTIRVFANELDAVFEVVQDSGLQLVDCESLPGQEFSSLNLAAQEYGYAVNKWVVTGFGAIFLASTIIGIGANYVSGAKAKESANAMVKLEEQVQRVVGDVHVTSQLSERISSVNKISATVTRAGGWIRKYSIDSAGNEEYDVELPEWVNRDYVDLFKGATIDRDRVKNVLIVHKGSSH